MHLNAPRATATGISTARRRTEEGMEYVSSSSTTTHNSLHTIVRHLLLGIFTWLHRLRSSSGLWPCLRHLAGPELPEDLVAQAVDT
uniref:Uncharacterized protein MANES_02G147300 n=1 Tax=Rhizophora mucronata TaxID=61149 RepID=A0A2P2PAA5_RHIMU